MAIGDVRQKLSDVVAALTAGDPSELPTGIVDRLYRFYKSIDLLPLRRITKSRVPAGSVVIDVGAHMGFATSLLSRRVGKGGLVFAIEPQTRCAPIIRRRCPSAMVVTAAAHRVDGRRELFTGGTFGTDSRITELAGETEVITLDTLLEDIGDRNVSFIKIDVQGGEANVLLGANTMLNRHRPDLFIELWHEGLRRAGHSLDELIALLSEIGYVPSRVSLVGSKLVIDSRFRRRAAKPASFNQLFVHESRFAAEIN